MDVDSERADIHHAGRSVSKVNQSPHKKPRRSSSQYMGMAAGVKHSTSDEKKIYEAALHFFGADVMDKSHDLASFAQELGKGLKDSGECEYVALGAAQKDKKGFVQALTKALEPYGMSEIICRPDSAVVRGTQVALRFVMTFNAANGKGAAIVRSCWLCDCEVDGTKVMAHKLLWLADLKEMDVIVKRLDNPPHGIRKASVLSTSRRMHRATPSSDEIRQLISDMIPVYYDGMSPLEEELSFVHDHFAPEGLFIGPGDIEESTADAYMHQRKELLMKNKVSKIAGMTESVVVGGLTAVAEVWLANLSESGMSLRQGSIIIEMNEKREIVRWEDTTYAKTGSGAGD